MKVGVSQRGDLVSQAKESEDICIVNRFKKRAGIERVELALEC